MKKPKKPTAKRTAQVRAENDRQRVAFGQGYDLGFKNGCERLQEQLKALLGVKA